MNTLKSVDNFKFQSMVTFGLELCRKVGGSKYCGFVIRIKEFNEKSISGEFSVMVDECDYIRDRDGFYNLKQGRSKFIYFFSDNLIDSLSSLSIHISVHFW